MIKLVNKYNGVNRALELEELIQKGIMGLIAAANKYNFQLDHKAKFMLRACSYLLGILSTLSYFKSFRDNLKNRSS